MPASKGQNRHLSGLFFLGEGSAILPAHCPLLQALPRQTLTSGISRGTRRTCMPCRTTGLGCSRLRPPATSGTSAEWKLEECEWRSLREPQPRGSGPLVKALIRPSPGHNWGHKVGGCLDQKQHRIEGPQKDRCPWTSWKALEASYLEVTWSQGPKGPL